MPKKKTTCKLLVKKLLNKLKNKFYHFLLFIYNTNCICTFEKILTKQFSCFNFNWIKKVFYFILPYVLLQGDLKFNKPCTQVIERNWYVSV